MTDPAFGPLDARAASDGPTPPDRISLRDHLRTAEVGAFGAERGLAQRLRFSVVAEVAAGSGDDEVDGVLSYDALAEAVDGALAEGRADLLETLAERVAARVLRAPQAARAFVRVEKLDRGSGDLGVEVVRERGAAPPPEPPPAPRVVLVRGDLDAGALSGGPVVVCVAAPGLPVPAAVAEPHRTRVALLALDQAAWALASRHPGLHVASTRTEIDWALRRGIPCVWAPSRLGEVADPRALAAWLARALGAEAPQ